MTAEQAEESTRRHNSVQDNSLEHESDIHQASEESAQYSPAMLTQSGRGSTSVHASAMLSAQQTHGNHAVQRAVQRSADTSGSSEQVPIQRFIEPAPWMDASPFVEPTPWLGHGGRHSGGNGLPSGPNIGIEPGNPGAGWAQAPHTPAPQIDNPMFPGGGPFFNPTPNIPLPFHDMPGGGIGMGTQPSQAGEAPGPWAYYKQNKQGGVEGGFGAFHGEGPIAGVPVSDDLLYGHGKLGMWDDGQGGTRYGAGGDVGVANWSINQGGLVSGQAEALTASAEASWGDSGATLGAQATLVGGSMTFGGDPTKGNDKDESVRLGLSEGVGMAGRLHWGDKDGDGHREYGVGADFGPFSFDIKSEDPVRTLSNTAMGPLMTNWLLGSDNATAPVEKAAGDTWNATKEAASEGWGLAKKYSNEVGEYAVNAYNDPGAALGNAYDTVSSYLPW